MVSSDDLTSDGPLAVAYGWIGQYDGWGGITVGDVRSDVTGLVLRITLDTGGSCQACLTVVLEPWFATGSLQIETGSEAHLTYEDQGVVRSLTIQRFSSGGQTANVLIVKLRHETAASAGVAAQTLVTGDLEFRKR